MVTKQQVIAALRCKETDPAELNCKACPYFHVEILTDKQLIKLVGSNKWEVCRFEDIFRDAADILEGSGT